MPIRSVACFSCGFTLSVALLLVGCTKLPSVVGAEDFEVERRDFHWEVGGTELYEISAGAEARSVFFRSALERRPLDRPDSRGRTEEEVRVAHWYEVKWTPSAEQLHELEVLVDQQRVLGLDDRYVDEDVSDGWSRTYSISALGQTKKIYCSNEAPEAIEALDALLERLSPNHDRGPVEGERELSTEELAAEGLI